MGGCTAPGIGRPHSSRVKLKTPLHGSDGNGETGMAKVTREELYALVWDRPMTKLAKEFGLSDVALHKICRKDEIPTPSLGYWAKKAHGKPVTNTPLPEGSQG